MKKHPDLPELTRANLIHPGLCTRSLICQRQNHIGVTRHRWRRLQLKVGQKKPQQSQWEQGGGQLSLCWRAATPTQRHHTTRVVGGGKVFELSQPVSFLNWPAAILYTHIFFGIPKPVPKQKPRNQIEEAEQ